MWVSLDRLQVECWSQIKLQVIPPVTGAIHEEGDFFFFLRHIHVQIFQNLSLGFPVYVMPECLLSFCLVFILSRNELYKVY